MVAGSREGYSITTFDTSEVWAIISQPSFWRMAARYWRTGFQEIYFSLSKAAFVRSMQKLVPEIKSSDLENWGSGVRAQAILPNGSLVDDFVIEETANAVHVINAPIAGCHLFTLHRPPRHRPRRLHLRPPFSLALHPPTPCSWSPHPPHPHYLSSLALYPLCHFLAVDRCTVPRLARLSGIDAKHSGQQWHSPTCPIPPK